jgi:hypothetical protein
VQRTALLVVLVIVLGGGAPEALADSSPVGALPSGPVTSIEASHGELIAVALSRRNGDRVWRIARAFDQDVLREISEAEVGPSVVLVFRTGHVGNTTLSLGLTKGDTSTKALESRRFLVRVR